MALFQCIRGNYRDNILILLLTSLTAATAAVAAAGGVCMCDIFMGVHLLVGMSVHM